MRCGSGSCVIVGTASGPSSDNAHQGVVGSSEKALSVSTISIYTNSIAGKSGKGLEVMQIMVGKEGAR